MTKEKAVSLLSQMFLIQFSKEEHEALAMAIDTLNADRKTEAIAMLRDGDFSKPSGWMDDSTVEESSTVPTISKME